MLACPSISGGHAGVPLHWLRSCRLAHPLVDGTYPFMDDFCPLYAGIMHVCVCVCVFILVCVCVGGCVCRCVCVEGERFRGDTLVSLPIKWGLVPTNEDFKDVPIC